MWSTKSLENVEFTTKNGDFISFKFIYDIEANKKNLSLWIVHKIEAYVNDELAGFITTSYIPSQRWNEKIEETPFPSEIVSADYFGGSSLGFRFRDTLPAEHKVLSSLSLGVAYDLHQIFTENNIDTKEYQEAKEFVIKRSISKHKERYEETKDFHVEKPLVDYLETEDMYRRQGIAHALYYAMASVVCENGYRLRSSGTKTDDGKAHFNSFARNYPEIITKEDDYYFIDMNLELNLLHAC